MPEADVLLALAFDFRGKNRSTDLNSESIKGLIIILLLIFTAANITIILTLPML